MARYKAKFGSTLLGDSVADWNANPTRLSTSTRALLWQDKAVVDDDSANVYWDVYVKAIIVRDTQHELNAAFEDLVETLLALGTQDLTIVDYDNPGTVRRRYASCRFDAPSKPSAGDGPVGRWTFDTAFHFVSASAPAAS